MQQLWDILILWFASERRLQLNAFTNILNDIVIALIVQLAAPRRHHPTQCVLSTNTAPSFSPTLPPDVAKVTYFGHCRQCPPALYTGACVAQPVFILHTVCRASNLLRGTCVQKRGSRLVRRVFSCVFVRQSVALWICRHCLRNLAQVFG
jgi:hypothetical protein